MAVFGRKQTGNYGLVRSEKRTFAAARLSATFDPSRAATPSAGGTGTGPSRGQSAGSHRAHLGHPHAAVEHLSGHSIPRCGQPNWCPADGGELNNLFVCDKRMSNSTIATQFLIAVSGRSERLSSVPHILHEVDG